MLELWGTWSTFLLLLPSASLRSGVVAPDRVEYNSLVFKLCTYAKLNCLK